MKGPETDRWRTTLVGIVARRPFEIEFARSAIEHLRGLAVPQQRVVVDGIEVRLSYEPLERNRNRKPLRTNRLAMWELRLGELRVYYDVVPDEWRVVIRAIGRKERDRVVIAGMEQDLTK